uniref:Far11/STRP C-terminal domain-containing protein n=1 Tax=Trichuris muris TaxID=70415 RepID=A0A5S6Q783_TRIMR
MNHLNGRSSKELRSGLAARRSAQLPKLATGPRKDQIDGCEAESDAMGEADIEFDYNDCDGLAQELNELYSYSESLEFFENYQAFRDFCSLRRFPAWRELNRSDRCRLVEALLDQLESSVADRRLKALQALAYLLQGCFMDHVTEDDLVESISSNAFLCYDCGVWSFLCMLLQLEVEQSKENDRGNKPKSDSLRNSHVLRLTLACMYTIVECVRRFECGTEGSGSQQPLSDELSLRTEVKCSLLNELDDAASSLNVVPILFDMVSRFCDGLAPHYPIRKLLLLLWKCLLAVLGGWRALCRLKNDKRLAFGLQPCEDTIEVASTMPAIPSLAFKLNSEREGSENGNGSEFMVPKRSKAPPKRQLANSSDGDSDELLEEMVESYSPPEADVTMIDGDFVTEETVLPLDPSTQRPLSPFPNEGKGSIAQADVKAVCRNVAKQRRLPWASKVTFREVENFLEMKRMKFFGYSFGEGDRMSTVGLPKPIQESYSAQVKHVYVSLAEVQIARERLIQMYPMTHKDVDQDTPSERLYQMILPNMRRLTFGLVKVLLASAPCSKGKADMVNIVYEVLPYSDGLESACSLVDTPEARRLNADVARQKEIIAKAVSALLLLILKHLKVNHVYQFEQVCQQLVFANCIPLILKYFDQNVACYVQSGSELADSCFIDCVLSSDVGDIDTQTATRRTEVNLLRANEEAEAVAAVVPKASPYVWRNLFALVNLLRVLNKLTKWKHGRTMMLVVYKSAPILKRALRVRQVLLQLFALKLLKSQVKFLGRQWRKSNMELLSAIYRSVRHRLNDDWAYGNETQSQDFQSEESSLMSEVDRFNMRRYGTAVTVGDFEPMDNNVISVLGAPFVYSERFRRNYEKWLEYEVFHSRTDYDQLLYPTLRFVSTQEESG